MRFSTASAFIVASLVAPSIAATCTVDDATPLEDLLASNNGGSGGGGGVAGGPDFVSVALENIGDYIKRRDMDIVYSASKIVRRSIDSVACTSSETCTVFSDAVFCLNVETGDFHDGLGTYGSFVTGDYVLDDGREGNIFTGPTPEPTNTVDGGEATVTGVGSDSGSGSSGGGSSGSGSESGSGTTGNSGGAAVQTGSAATDVPNIAGATVGGSSLGMPTAVAALAICFGTVGAGLVWRI